MSVMSHPPTATEGQKWIDHLRIREMWASIAITAMWVAVVFSASWGPDARFTSNDGSSSTIPTAVFVTLFAFLGSWAVAKYAFRRQETE